MSNEKTIESFCKLETRDMNFWKQKYPPLRIPKNPDRLLNSNSECKINIFIFPKLICHKDLK